MLIIQRPEIEAGEAEGNVQSFTISPPARRRAEQSFPALT